MRKFLVLTFALLLGSVMGVSQVSAAGSCRTGQVLRPVGSVQTGDAVISTQGFDVRLITLTCGGSACVAGLWDVDTLGDTGDNSKVKFELGAAANVFVSFPANGSILEQPIAFNDGIVFVDNANVDNIIVYACQQR